MKEARIRKESRETEISYNHTVQLCLNLLLFLKVRDNKILAYLKLL